MSCLRRCGERAGCEPLEMTATGGFAMGEAHERRCAIADLWMTVTGSCGQASRAFEMARGSLRGCLAQALLSRCDLARRLLKRTPSVDRHCLALQILVDRKELLDLLA